VLNIRRSKLCYTAFGIITLKQVNGLKLLKYNSINTSTQCSKHVEAYNKSYYKKKKLCIKLVSYQDSAEMHSKQNIIFFLIYCL